MTAESILERIKQKPFRSIALETIGGTRIELDRKTAIFFYDRKQTACVVTRKGSIEMRNALVPDRRLAALFRHVVFKLDSPNCLEDIAGRKRGEGDAGEYYFQRPYLKAPVQNVVV